MCPNSRCSKRWIKSGAFQKKLTSFATLASRMPTRKHKRWVWHHSRDAIALAFPGGRPVGCLGTTTGYHLASLQDATRFCALPGNDIGRKKEERGSPAPAFNKAEANRHYACSLHRLGNTAFIGFGGGRCRWRSLAFASD